MNESSNLQTLDDTAVLPLEDCHLPNIQLTSASTLSKQNMACSKTKGFDASALPIDRAVLPT